MARLPGWRTWRRVAAATVLLLACAIAGAFWLAGTEAALRWTVARAVEAGAGRLVLEDVRGSLYGPLSIGRFAFQDGDRRIEGSGLALDWSPRTLLRSQTVTVRSLALQSLVVNAGKPGGEPPQLPPTLRLPLRVEIRNAKVDGLALATEGGRHEFRALALELDNADGRFHAVASVRTPWGRGEADLTLADAPPYALSGRAALERDDGAHPYALSATFEGTLAAIHVSAKGGSRGAQAELRAEIAPLEPMPLGRAELRLARVDARRFGAGLPNTDLSADLTLRAHGGHAIAGELKLANGAPGAIDASLAPLREAQLDFEGDLAALTLRAVRLDFGDAGRFAGAGSLRQDRLNLVLETPGFDLRGIYTSLAATKLSGSLTLDADTRGAAQAVRADLREGAYRLHLEASHRDDTVEIRAANVSLAGSELALNGTLSLAQPRAFRAHARLSRFDPSRLGDYPAARINGDITASGHLYPGPEVALQFSVPDSRYRGHRLQGKGRASVSPGRIRDSDVELTLGDNRLSARGAFGAAGDGLDWLLEGGDLAAFMPGLAGQLHGSGRLEGTLAEPSGTFRAQGRNLAWEGKHRVAEFTAEGKAEQGIDGPLALRASLRDFRSDALRIASASVAASGRRGGHELSLAARSEAFDARAALSGGWSEGTGWSGHILSFDNRGPYAAELQAPASLAVHGAEFSLGKAALRFARGTVRIDELARSKGGLYSAGTLSGIHAGTLLGLLGRPLPISSTLTLGGRWKLAAAQAINGELDLRRERGDLTVLTEPATSAGLTRLELSATAQEDRLSARLDAAGAVLGSIAGGVRTTLARHEGSVGLPGSATLAFDASLDLPSLAWVTPLLGGRMAVGGSLRGKFGGGGTVAQPALNGSIGGDGLSFEFPEQGIYLKDGVLRARLQGNRLLLERIALRGREGTLEGSGSVAWQSGAASARVALKASGLEVTRRLDRLLVISGSAEATLEDKRVHASATLKADRGEIELPETAAPTLSDDVVVLGRDAEVQKQLPAFVTEVELGLDLGEKFFLKGKGVDARLAGGVTLRARTGLPATASGSIRVARGNYSAYGQRLAIERGILNFSGPLDNPGLDIVAMRKQQAVEAGVAIRGTALAPSVSLVSKPAVPDSEKLSWLILGRGTAGANRAELGVLQLAAGALLARGDSVMLQNRMAHAAGLDEIGLSGTGGLETTVLTLGKRLSSRAYLSFEQGIAAATHLVKITYTLTPRLSVRAQTGTDSALDAFYTFSFR